MKSDELFTGISVVDTYKIVRQVFTDMDGGRAWVLFTDGSYRIVEKDYEWIRV